MTESEMEEGLDAKIVPQNQLQVIIKETGLEQQLAEEFTINFQEHFRMASEWAKKAKKIIVTDASQIVTMQEARTARLFLREKRIEIENFRKQKKEYYLNAGRAIDKVAGFLKDMIIPTEEHLDRMEHFVELKKKSEDEAILAREHARLEAERIAQEEASRKEQERLRIENEKLRKEASEKERINQEELKRVHKINEEAVQREREKTIKAEAELRAKQQAEARAEADRLKAEEALKSAGDIEKLLHWKEKIQEVIANTPEVKGVNSIRILEDAKSHLYLALRCLKQVQLEEEI